MMNIQRHRAFTLIEMIAAVAIIAVIAVSLYGSVRIAFTARKRSDTNIASRRMLRHAIDQMSVDLLGATPVDGVLQREFVGEADWLRFCCNTARDGADMQLVEYAAVEDGDGVDIVRRVTRNLLAQIEPLPDEHTIAAHVQSFNIRYYDGYDWLDQWNAAMRDSRLPLAVEIAVALNDRDQLITTVRPAIAQPAADDTLMIP
jgi:prepilin-type N-terminal cleavage/methylation domain-containing protein